MADVTDRTDKQKDVPGSAVSEAQELEAAFSEGYSFEAAGRKYTVRRLNTRDLFALTNICAAGLRALALNMPGGLAGLAASNEGGAEVGKGMNAAHAGKDTGKGEGKSADGGGVSIEIAPGVTASVTIEGLIAALVAAIPVIEDRWIEWAGSLIGLSAEEYAEASPELTLGILEVLKDHVDVKAFFGRLVRLVKGHRIRGPQVQ